MTADGPESVVPEEGESVSRGPVRWEARCRAGVSRTEDGCGEIEAPCRGAEAAGAALKSMHMIWVAFEIDVAVAFGSQFLLHAVCRLPVTCWLAGMPVSTETDSFCS